MIIKKTANTLAFIKEWLELCQIPQCIIKNNKYHQCDQAILNILLYKYKYNGIIFTNDKSDSKKYSFFWKELIKYIEQSNLNY